LSKWDLVNDLVVELCKIGPSRRLYTQVNKLIRLMLTIPASSATAEPSLSSLRRLKTNARSTMTAAHVALLHVHSARTDSLKTWTLCVHLWQQLTLEMTHLDTIN